MTTPTGASVWRQYVVDGVPASGPHPPVKSEVIAWADSLEGEVAAATTTAGGAVTSANSAVASVATILPLPNGMLTAPVPKTSTVTITVASPGVVSWTSHGLLTGAPIAFTTTGALPTGLTATTISTSTGAVPSGGTIYYVIAVNANTFRLATTLVNAVAGTAVNTSGTQSGTHTATANFLAPGTKGYMVEAELGIGSPQAVLNQVATTIISMSLPAGIYDITGEAIMTSGATVWATEYHIAVTTTAPPTVVGLPNKGGGAGDHQTWATAQGSVFPVGPMRLFLLTTTTVYLAAYVTFGTNGTNGSGNLNGFGYIRAEQI